MLDFIEETFDQVSLLVQMGVILPRFFAVLARRDHRFCCFLRNLDQKCLRVIRAIRNHPLEFKIGKQVFGLGDIVALPACQAKPQRVAQRIYAGVDFGAESTPAAPEGLACLPTAFFDAPAAQGCARTMVLSSKIFSMSGSLAKW